MKKNYVSLLLASIMAFSLASCQEGSSKEKKMTKKTLDVYTFTIDAKETMDFYYEGEDDSVIYITHDDLAEMLSNITDINYSYEIDKVNQIVKMNNDIKDASITINFKKDRIYSPNLELFTTNVKTNSSIDICVTLGNENSDLFPLKKNEAASFYNLGGPLEIDLSKYNIDLIWSDGVGYLPLQTISDLFLTSQGCPICFNGDIVVIPQGSISDPELLDKYYGTDKRNRSQKLIDFNYNELCLNLDLNYGLKEEHGIKDFDSFFKNTGYEKDLKDPDPEISSKAFNRFIAQSIDDLHSEFKNPSPYLGEPQLDEKYSGPMEMSYQNEYNIFASGYVLTNSIDQSQPDFSLLQKPSYMEEGDTAFVYFNSFHISDVDYYDPMLAPSETNDWFVEACDTLGLVQHAHKMITRENSPIRNVVVDLSTNSGGQVDAAAYVLGWLTGDVQVATNEVIGGYIPIHNKLTNTRGINNYLSDVNLDGEFDYSDTLASANVKKYCLTSAVSFSCGNLVPMAIKNSGKATLIGQPTSGGTCAVLHGTSADGMIFSISSPLQLSYYKNGIYYGMDGGIEPDYRINDFRCYYLPKVNNLGTPEEETIYRGQLIDFINEIQ